MNALDLNTAEVIGHKKSVISLICAKLKALDGLNVLVAAFYLYNADSAWEILKDQLKFTIHSGYYNGKIDRYALFLVETNMNKGYWYFEFSLNSKSMDYKCVYLGCDYNAVDELKEQVFARIEPEYWLF